MSVPAPIRVQMEPCDIENGSQGSPSHCPIAFAMKRIGFPNVGVCVCGVSIGFCYVEDCGAHGFAVYRGAFMLDVLGTEEAAKQACYDHHAEEVRDNLPVDDDDYNGHGSFERIQREDSPSLGDSNPHDPVSNGVSVGDY